MERRPYTNEVIEKNKKERRKIKVEQRERWPYTNKTIEEKKQERWKKNRGWTKGDKNLHQ